MSQVGIGNQIDVGAMLARVRGQTMAHGVVPGVGRYADGGQVSSWKPTQLSSSEEAQFQAWFGGPEMKPWRDQFYARYGERPGPDGDYDYRGAWKAGMRPEPSPYDDNFPHWSDQTPSGKWLKSPDHPTRWKGEFMNATGVDPDSIGVTTKEAAQKYLKSPPPGQGIAAYANGGQVYQTGGGGYGGGSHGRPAQLPGVRGTPRVADLMPEVEAPAMPGYQSAGPVYPGGAGIGGVTHPVMDAPATVQSSSRGPLTAAERDLLARTVWGEARDQPFDGQVGVASVALNRVAQGGFAGGSDLTGVIKAEGQFEPWNRADATAAMLGLSPESAQYKRAMAAVDAALAGDPTGGSTYFLNRDYVMKRSGKLPKWAKGAPTAVIAQHAFFNPSVTAPGIGIGGSGGGTIATRRDAYNDAVSSMVGPDAVADTRYTVGPSGTVQRQSLAAGPAGAGGGGAGGGRSAGGNNAGDNRAGSVGGNSNGNRGGGGAGGGRRSDSNAAGDNRRSGGNGNRHADGGLIRGLGRYADGGPVYHPYEGDYFIYGQAGGEHVFIDYQTPPAPIPTGSGGVPASPPPSFIPAPVIPSSPAVGSGGGHSVAGGSVTPAPSGPGHSVVGTSASPSAPSSGHGVVYHPPSTIIAVPPVAPRPRVVDPVRPAVRPRPVPTPASPRATISSGSRSARGMAAGGLVQHYHPYTGDYYTYGQRGPEWQFITYDPVTGLPVPTPAAGGGGGSGSGGATPVYPGSAPIDRGGNGNGRGAESGLNWSRTHAHEPEPLGEQGLTVEPYYSQGIAPIGMGILTAVDPTSLIGGIYAGGSMLGYGTRTIPSLGKYNGGPQTSAAMTSAQTRAALNQAALNAASVAKATGKTYSGPKGVPGPVVPTVRIAKSNPITNGSAQAVNGSASAAGANRTGRANGNSPGGNNNGGRGSSGPGSAGYGGGAGDNRAGSVSGNKRAAGGLINGIGGGREDNIPAMLSAGEFVIPADVVSIMGQGNTDAGGTALERMIADVRRQGVKRGR